MKSKTQAKKTARKSVKDKPQPESEKVLILRTCDKDMKSHGGFQWPDSGPVSAPDWRKDDKCGGGLHGWLWGSGDWQLKAKGDDIQWIVFEADKDSVVDLGGKVKVPSGVVLAKEKSWDAAMAFIRGRMPIPVESSATGDYGHASATGDSGHASATGDYGHASATGYSGHASATGNSGHASATGYYGHASATGDYGHASATGNSGHASATGDSGHASATGDSGHASATGYSGHASASYNGKSRAGKNGLVSVLYWCEKDNRPRLIVGYVGEDGIKANTWYKAENGKLVEAKGESK